MTRSGGWRIVLIGLVLSSVTTTSVLGQTRFTIQRACALRPSVDDWDLGGFDTMEVNYRDGLFQMWYGASDSGNFRNGQQIGYAWSEDGCSWQRHELNPILTNLLSWESAGIYSPTVIQDATDSVGTGRGASPAFPRSRADPPPPETARHRPDRRKRRSCAPPP